MTAPARPVPTFATHGDFRQYVTGKPAERCPEAAAIASRCLTAAAGHVTQLWAEGGMDALVAACFVPGGPSREEIAARYEVILGLAEAA